MAQSEPGRRLSRMRHQAGDVARDPDALGAGSGGSRRFKGDAFYSGLPDRLPSAPVHQITNPTRFPIIARLTAENSAGQKLELVVRRETPTQWYEVLAVDDVVVSGSKSPGGSLFTRSALPRGDPSTERQSRGSRQLGA